MNKNGKGYKIFKFCLIAAVELCTDIIVTKALSPYIEDSSKFKKVCSHVGAIAIASAVASATGNYVDNAVDTLVDNIEIGAKIGGE